MVASKATVLVCVLLCMWQCGSVLAQTGLSEEEKQEVLDSHNRVRSTVNPIATNMERMVWNDELAQVAQNWAEQCQATLNPDISSQTPSFTSVGQTGFITSQDSVNYTEIMEILWFNAEYDYYNNTCHDPDGCSSYIQIVWAESSNLGCGTFRCGTLIFQSSTFPNATLFFCNYGPGFKLTSSTGLSSKFNQPQHKYGFLM